MLTLLKTMLRLPKPRGKVCDMRHFAVQKGVFCILKCGILHRKVATFSP